MGVVYLMWAWCVQYGCGVPNKRYSIPLGGLYVIKMHGIMFETCFTCFWKLTLKLPTLIHVVIDSCETTRYIIPRVYNITREY